MHHKTQKCIELLNRSLSNNPQELDELDWKAAIGKSEKMARHLSAFSNLEGGGYLVFGVSDNASVDGLDPVKSREIADQMGNWARDTVEPEIRIETFPFVFKGKNLLAAFIPEAFEKPVFLKGKSLEDSFIRAGGQSRKMNRDEIRRAMLTSRHQRFEELAAVLPPTIAKNWESHFDFTEFLRRTKLPVSGQKQLHEYLVSHKLAINNDGRIIPSNLCVITCAKDFSHLPSYERFAVRVTEYEGTNKMITKRDKTFSEGASISLDKIVDYIRGLLPTSEIMLKATKMKTGIIPDISIRELVINAIMHRDFSRTNSFITIEIFSDRIEITNPGGLVPDISVDRLIDHPSVCRNEVLADFLRKVELAEERGSGVDNAIEAIEVYGLPPINFQSQRDYFKATILMPKKYSQMSKEERVATVYQHSCLNSFMGKKTTNSSLRERFKFTEDEKTKVGRLITDALEAQKIKLANPNASRRDFHYLPYWA